MPRPTATETKRIAVRAVLTGVVFGVVMALLRSDPEAVGSVLQAVVFMVVYFAASYALRWAGWTKF